MKKTALYAAMVALLLLTQHSASAEWPVTTDGTLLVMNKSDNSVTLVDLGSGKTVATLPTGIEPHEGAASPDGRLVVISNTDYQDSGTHTLTVIDVPGRSVKATIPLGDYANPHGIVFMPDGERVIATVEGSQAIILVDISAGKVEKAIKTPGLPCHMVVPTPDGRRAFATSIQLGSLVVLDLEKGVMTKAIATGKGAEGFDISPDGKEIWVGNRAEDTITVVDAESLEINGTIESKGFPIRLKFTAAGDRVLVSNYRAGKVTVYDRATRKPVGSVAMEEDAAPIGILVAPDGRHAFIANTRADKVTVIDIEDMKIVAALQAGKTPDGMALTLTR
jgi:DNA-binding beta-propeller fold protein YncE